MKMYVLYIFAYLISTAAETWRTSRLGFGACPTEACAARREITRPSSKSTGEKLAEWDRWKLVQHGLQLALALSHLHRLYSTLMSTCILRVHAALHPLLLATAFTLFVLALTITFGSFALLVSCNSSLPFTRRAFGATASTCISTLCCSVLVPGVLQFLLVPH